MAAVQSKSTLLGLQKVELFKGLDSYSLREIAAQCQWTRCRRNEYVVRREDIGREVYFVIAGTLRITAAAGRGRRIILEDIGAGGVFGEHSALDGRERRPWPTCARCASRSSARSRPKRSGRSWRATASVRERLLQRLTGSVRELTDRLLELGAQPVQRRIRIELLRRARIAGVDATAPARPGPDALGGREPRRHCARAGDARAVPPGAAGGARAGGARSSCGTWRRSSS